MMASTIARTSLMAIAVATTSVISLTGTDSAHALGFTGSYAPANFTLNTNGTGGSVDTTGAPNSISITGGNIGISGLTSFTTTAAGSGLVGFDWDYSTSDVDGPFFDPFGYILNNVFTQLTNNSGPFAQSGFASFNVSAGDSFGFGVLTTDGGFGSATATISNFSVTPIPTPALLPGLIGMGAMALRKRKAEAVEPANEA